MVKLSILLLPSLIRLALAFPAYGSLAGLTQFQVYAFVAGNELAPIPPPPGPLKDGGIKLVNNASHPFMPPGPDDLRGPCPALNTLANHGYIPRTGVARPDQLVTAVMEGFNLGNDFAKFLVYQGQLLDGNPLTNLISIGMKTPKTGTDPPPPAIVGGLAEHDTFEGDTSMTRVDAYFGDPVLFNEDLFKDFSAFSLAYGVNRTYVAAELRHQRLRDSIQTNPKLSFRSPRIASAYSEAVFPTIFFVDGRLNNGQLDLKAAYDFFGPNQYPADFYRQPAPVDFLTINPLVTKLFDKYPFVPGVNHGVGNYTELPDTPTLSDFCGIYEDIVLRVLKSQYPNPTGVLLDALNTNLDFFYSAVKTQGCKQVFPFPPANVQQVCAPQF